MINILYFASVRERLGRSEEELETDKDTDTVSALMSRLASRDDTWKQVFSDNPQLLFSVNQVMAKATQVIEDGDEIAFFPQVTGG